MVNILHGFMTKESTVVLSHKRDYCSFIITHFPQNSIIPTAPRMEFNFHTSTATLKQFIF
jgi:hypothetical protein